MQFDATLSTQPPRRRQAEPRWLGLVSLLALLLTLATVVATASTIVQMVS